MADWRPQLYRAAGKAAEVENPILEAAIAAGESVIAVNPSLPPIFTLKHLAHLTGADYGLLRMIVARRIKDPYRVYRVRKRGTGNGGARFRVICAPNPSLLIVQRWLAKNVLTNAQSQVHPASTAYAPGSKLVDAAQPHCRCRWLIKVDVRSFFESISEISAYRAYRSLGYQRLVSLELARLSTRLGPRTWRTSRRRWRQHHYERYSTITAYKQHWLGHLPQGAPTSPMLANMAMLAIDKQLSRWAQKHKMTYTRYADDMSFSTTEKLFDRADAALVVRGVYRIIGGYGLSPNVAKTPFVPPRARKLVLGLLVDGAKPRLTREFKSRLRMHLYYLEHPAVGPAKHSQARGFSAVAGLRNHLKGLVAFATQVEPICGTQFSSRLKKIMWPI